MELITSSFRRKLGRKLGRKLATVNTLILIKHNLDKWQYNYRKDKINRGSTVHAELLSSTFSQISYFPQKEMFYSFIISHLKYLKTSLVAFFNNYPQEVNC